MTSYNQVNGAYANENKYLPLDILRGEWDFDGIVIRDWGGSNDHVQGVAARSNLELIFPVSKELPSPYSNGNSLGIQL